SNGLGRRGAGRWDGCRRLDLLHQMATIARGALDGPTHQTVADQVAFAAGAVEEPDSSGNADARRRAEVKGDQRCGSLEGHRLLSRRPLAVGRLLDGHEFAA